MNSPNSSENSNPFSPVEDGIQRISNKLTLLQEQLRVIQANRSTMENKIADAQTRIQKILNRLPNQEDTRQLKLIDDAPIRMDGAVLGSKMNSEDPKSSALESGNE